MRLERYDVTITISIPGDPGTAIKVVLERSERDKILESTITAPILKMFEELIEDDPE